MGGVHLAEVPLESEEYVPSHYQAVRIFFVVGRDRVGEVSRLVQDIVHCQAEVEGSDVLGDLCVPPHLG